MSYYYDRLISSIMKSRVCNHPSILENPLKFETMGDVIDFFSQVSSRV